MNSQNFSIIVWPLILTSLVILCIFSLFQLNNTKILAHEKEIQALSSKAELSFLKGFEEFEKYFVAKSRSVDLIAEYKNSPLDNLIDQFLIKINKKEMDIKDLKLALEITKVIDKISNILN